MNTKGKFIISLDFELLWGVRDKRTPATYGANILGVWDTLPKMLDVFEKHKIKATFAIVGFLFASSKRELIDYCPISKPNYTNINLSPYNGHFDLLKEYEHEDKYHFGSKLIELIIKYPEQEIGTHTFSHYYCLESGQERENFKDDILSAIRISKKMDVDVKSLVFPRNQFNKDYLEVLKNLGITSYRGNENIWFHKESSGEDNLMKRAFRLLDSYVNISGHNCYHIEEIMMKEPFDIPSSRFLRPFSQKTKILDGIRIRRILKSMTYAAKKGMIYHLWWHPHNFGINERENFISLEKILTHYTKLNIQYGFESSTMKNLSEVMQQMKEK